MYQIEQIRKETSVIIDRKRKSLMGQFMTPSSVAMFMAGMFTNINGNAVLLDAGAGVGSLSAAFFNRLKQGGFNFKTVSAVVYEIDEMLRDQLKNTVAVYASNMDIAVQVLSDDFIESAVASIKLGTGLRFTHAILNPPYKKINSNSYYRKLLRLARIETVNLYTAFVALAVELMIPGGQVVAIVPRSFCNGPYYRPFREFILERAAIKRMHLFGARDKAFRDEEVLQENVIVLLERNGMKEDVVISTSTDDTFKDLEEQTYKFETIISPGDSEKFIHIPIAGANTELPDAFNCSLSDIGVGVSTGPVVDFRVKNHLRDMPEDGSVPLLYPVHFVGHHGVVWPQENIKKPNALMFNEDTKKWLYPNGHYVVTRRFSSKEERRRIMASVVEPDFFDSEYLGFENHLNVFHKEKKGLNEDLAWGISAYLNSTIVDRYFRRFSGHTQVNATDIRQMKYPCKETLLKIGRWAKEQGKLTQESIDRKIQDNVNE